MSNQTYDIQFITTYNQLRKQPIKDLKTEDLRIMIGQNISLKHLISLAFKILKDDILAESDFYKGNLLKSIMIIKR